MEEEYQIIDPLTRELAPRVQPILDEVEPSAGTVEPELRASQVEIGTPVCATLAEVRAELVGLRRAVIAAAGNDESVIGAAGTHPFSAWQDQPVTPKARYLALASDYQQVAREQIVFGFHVHIGIGDRATAIQTIGLRQTFRPESSLKIHSHLRTP